MDTFCQTRTGFAGTSRHPRVQSLKLATWASEEEILRQQESQKELLKP